MQEVHEVDEYVTYPGAAEKRVFPWPAQNLLTASMQ